MARIGLGLSLCALLAGASAVDVHRRVIPNRLLGAAAAVALAMSAAAEPASLPERLAAAALAGAPLVGVSLACPRGLGMGDAKLAAVMGLYLGRAIVPALLVAFGAGTAAGAILVVRHGIAARKRALPFAPFLALGGFAGLAAN